MSKTSTDAPATRHVLSGQTMGTRWSAVLPRLRGHDAAHVGGLLAQAADLVDAQMSTWKPGSDLMRLNGAAPGTWVPLPPAMMEVLEASLAYGRLTEGAFDIGVGAAVAAWGFGAWPDPAGAPAPPPSPAIDLLELDPGGGRARKHGPASLDLSGIAKGYAVDRMAHALDDLGLDAYLVSIDGELRARGERLDGAPFAVALERPEPGRRATFGVIELRDAAVATSGDYRHRHRRGGRWVSHTIDPATGAPVDHALASATVVAPTAMAADALATALMVAGPVAGAALADRLSLDAILVARDPAGLRLVETGRFASEEAA